MEEKKLTPMEMIIIQMIDRLCDEELDNVELDFDTKYHIARRFINNDDIFDMIYQVLLEYIKGEVDEENEQYGKIFNR